MRIMMQKMIKGFLIVLVATAIALILLPSLLSTQLGSKQILAIINYLIPGEMELRRMDLRWGKGQVIEGFHLKDPQGNSVLEIEKFSSETPLWRLLIADTQIGLTHIHNLNASVVANPREWINFNRSLGMTVQDAPTSTFAINAFHAKMELPGNSNPSMAWLKGEVQHRTLRGSVLVDFRLKDYHPSSWNEFKGQLRQYVMQGAHEDDTIELRLIDFPPLLMDELSSFSNPRLKGLFHALFGDRLSFILQTQPSLGKGFSGSIQAPQIDGLLAANVENKQLIVQEPSTLDFHLTPELVNSFTPDRTRLLREAPLKLKITHFSIPLAAMGNHSPSQSLFSCGFNIDTELASTELNLHPLGLVNISHFNAHLESSAGDSFMDVKVVGHAEHYKQPIDINYERRLQKSSSTRF